MKAKGKMVLSKMLPSILLLALSCFVSASERLCMEVTSQCISNICSHASNPSFCLRLLNSMPGTSNADLSSLARSTIELARTNATSNLDLVHLLLQNATNPKLEERYTDCLDLYDDAIQNLAEADEKLNARDYNGVSAEVSAAMDGAADCLDGFDGPPADPLFAECSQELENICSILLVISNFLLQQKS